jgi:hypothetical protein
LGVFNSDLALLPIHIVKAYSGENPLKKEVGFRVVDAGQAVVVEDPAGARRTIDNLHQTSLFSVDEPDISPGCPECVHVHWRWASHLRPGFPNVDSAFEGGGGRPLIPPLSLQDIDIAVTRADRGQEDPPDYVSLIDQQDIRPGFSNDPVMWYVATGHQESDKFFLHGVFFSDRGGLPEISGFSARLLRIDAGFARVRLEFTVGAPSENFTLAEAWFQAVLQDERGNVIDRWSGTANLDRPVSNMLFGLVEPGSIPYRVVLTVAGPNGLKSAASVLVTQ